MSMLRMARVADVHPEDNSVDIVMVDDGSRYPGVQVLAPTATTNCGYADLPSVTATSDKFDLTQSTDRDALAVVGFMAPTLPVVLGFLWPQVNQVLFADQNRRIVRHASDVYTSTDKDGNFELYHPSGTYLRIGTDGAHEDLTGKDFDKQWKISKNTDKAVHVKLRVSNAGDDKASLDIDPSGNIALQCDGNVTATIGGNVTATVAGNLSATISGTTYVESTGNATLKAPQVTIDSPQTTCTGKLTVQGLLTFQANMTGTGTMSNNGINVGSTHVHGGVSAGAANTAIPH